MTPPSPGPDRGIPPFLAARRAAVSCLGLALALSFFVDLAVLVVPVYDMQLYDRVVQSRNMSTLEMLSVVCLVGLVLYGTVDYLRGAAFVVLSDRLGRRLHFPVLEAAVRRRAAGDEKAGVEAIRDLNEIRVFLSSGDAAAPLDALCAPLLLAVMFVIHPAYGWIGIFGVAMMLSFGLALEWRERPAISDASARRTALSAAFAARLSDTAVTDGMGMLPAVARRWSADQDAVLAQLGRASGRADMLTVGAQVCRLLLQAFMMSAGAVMIIGHATSPGSLMGANLLLAKSLSPFDHLVASWRSWGSAHSAWTRLEHLLQDTAGGTPALFPGRAGLDVEGLTLVRDGRKLLDGVSFHLPRGSTVGVVGPNGCGKSTLLRVLGGTMRPDAGSVALGGIPMPAPAGRVGYLPQSVAMLDGSIGENISRFAPDDAGADRLVDAARRAGVHDMVGRMRRGYETRIGDGGPALSGGQRQRVALARALYGAPDLIILDEPDASVDHEGEAALVRAVGQARERGAVVVVVTHRPGLLAALDHRLEMEGGRVVSFGAVPDTWKPRSIVA